MSWTERLRKTSSVTLFDIQEQTLEAAVQKRGVVCAARVGAGKTLLSGTLPVALGAKRTLIVVSGKGEIPEKTRKEFQELRKSWRLVGEQDDVYYQTTYEALSRADGEEILKLWQPELIVADEVHNWRRVTANAGARKVAKWMHEHPETMFAGLTGSLFKFGLADYAHFFHWAFGEDSPLPGNTEDIALWAKAAAGDPDAIARVGLTPQQIAERVHNYPGFVISDDVFDGVKLTMEPWFVDSGLEKELEDVRTNLVKPDGSPLVLGDDEDDSPGAGSVASVCRQIATGFYYVPSPTPPASYVAARKAWVGFANARISSGEFYSELQVKRWVRQLGGGPLEKLERWEKARDEFKYESVPVWLSDRVVHELGEWSKQGGIIWTANTALGERLSGVCGIPWYGPGGKTRGGASILRARAPAIAASAKAVGVGHNLQRYNRACVTNCPSNAADLEQLVGREFRHGQLKDVHVDILVSCAEHYYAFDKAKDLAILEEKQMLRPNILSSLQGKKRK